MIYYFFNLIFLFTSSFFTIKTIGYAIYEYKREKNKTGAIAVAIFSVLVTIFANWLVFIK